MTRYNPRCCRGPSIVYFRKIRRNHSYQHRLACPLLWFHAMIPALKLRSPSVAIHYPANDGSAAALETPVIRGSLVRNDPRRLTEVAADYFGRPTGLDIFAWNQISPATDRHEALLRKLTIEDAERIQLDLSSGEVACRIQLFRDRFQLESVTTMRGFLSHAGMTFERLASFFRAEALVDRMEQLYAASIEREMNLHRAFLSACAGLSRRSERPAPIDDLMDPGLPERALRRRLLLGRLAMREIERRGAPDFAAEVNEAIERFRERFGLLHADDLARWIERSGLTKEAFAQQMQAFAAVLRLERENAASIAEGIKLCQAVRSIGTWPGRGADNC